MLNNELLLAEKHLFFMDMTSPESLSANSTELKVLAVCNIEQINDWMFVSVLKSQKKSEVRVCSRITGLKLFALLKCSPMK